MRNVGRYFATLSGCGASRPGGSEMKTRTIVNVNLNFDLKVDVAAIIRALAVFFLFYV